ncbi:hypothetical protein [Streptomyces sp. NBC_00158]|uniref:hypothetical protein n=1 Tax=Streptomyces sp. NBC_00158 TaxID=2903627 RepID=UPI003243E988
MLDGLAVHANTEERDRPPAITRMALTTAERELGLPAGALDLPATPPASSPDIADTTD